MFVRPSRSRWRVELLTSTPNEAVAKRPNRQLVGNEGHTAIKLVISGTLALLCSEIRSVFAAEAVVSFMKRYTLYR